METEAQLIRDAAAGDNRAFEQLLAKHQDMVFAICMRTLRDRDNALDAVQDTFLTVFRKIDRFSAKSSFRTWLYRVTLNTCYDQLRKRRRHQTEPLSKSHEIADLSTEKEFASVEIRPDIARALSEIPETFRDAILLADLDAIPLAEVAEILGIPIGTVKSRIYRGRRQLAEILGNLNPSNQRQREA